MRHSLIVWAVIAILAKAEFESTEDMQPYTYNFYAPSSLQFNDIYTNRVGTATEEIKKEMDEELITTTEESYLLNSIQSQYVEFHPEISTVPPTIPPPKYILNSTFLKETPPTKSTTTTEDPEDSIVRVVPIPKNLQRGVLDLLFPATRVKSFKNIFNSIRRMLSHTFRR